MKRNHLRLMMGEIYAMLKMKICMETKIQDTEVAKNLHNQVDNAYLGILLTHKVLAIKVRKIRLMESIIIAVIQIRKRKRYGAMWVMNSTQRLSIVIQLDISNLMIPSMITAVSMMKG